MMENGKKWKWQLVSEFFKKEDPLFKNMWFLEGYDISSNIYVIQQKEDLMIIDPGNDYTAYIELFQMGFKPQQIRLIVVTHGHPEHVMGTFELMRSYPYILKEDFKVMYHVDAPYEFKNLLSQFGCKTEELRGDEDIRFGDFVFEVLHTPGHTADSICLYHKSSNSLFSGDTVLPYAVASPDPVGGGRIDYHLFSVKIMKRMGIKNLFPGHGTPVLDRAYEVLEGTIAGIIKKIIGLETPWVEGAKYLASKGYLEECIFCCDRELSVNPDNVLALSLKASCLNDIGRYSEAIKIYDDITNRIGDNMFALIGKGVSLLGLGEYEKAVEMFDKAIEKDTNAKAAYVYKGMALYMMGKVEEAMAIDGFRKEFVEKFKAEIEKLRAERGK